MSLTMTTGMELRLERTAARVRLGTLAARVGRHASTINRWEGAAVVPADRAAEYRAALAAIVHGPALSSDGIVAPGHGKAA